VGGVIDPYYYSINECLCQGLFWDNFKASKESPRVNLWDLLVPALRVCKELKEKCKHKSKVYEILVIRGFTVH